MEELHGPSDDNHGGGSLLPDLLFGSGYAAVTSEGIDTLMTNAEGSRGASESSPMELIPYFVAVEEEKMQVGSTDCY